MIDVKTDDIETPEMVAERIHKALKVLPPERIFILPDCGLFHLSRDVAFAKLKAMVEGTRIVRKELGKVKWRAAESTSRSAHQRPFLLHGGIGGERLDGGGEAVGDGSRPGPDPGGGGSGHHQLRGRLGGARSHPRGGRRSRAAAESQRPSYLRESRSAGRFAMRSTG